MSSFDKRVCQWLNTASVPDKSKQTILSRMSVGIQNYRNLGLEKLATNPTMKVAAEHRIDYSLLDQISAALYRIEEGSTKGTEPLFPTAQPTTLGETKTFNANSSEEVDAADEARSESKLETFTFGEDAPFGSSQPLANDNANDEGDDIDAGEFDEKEVEELRRRAMKRQSRNAVSAEPISMSAAKHFKLHKFSKSPDVVQRLVKVLETHNLFAHLEDTDIVDVAESMVLVNFKRGEFIAMKGQSNDRMFVVVAGSVNDVDAQKRVNVGGCFGDVGLMYDVQNSTSFEAAVNGTQVCSIDRNAYQSICSRSSQEKRERYESFLSGVETLKQLTPTERLQIADALKTSKYAKGEKLISHGDDGNWFFLILEGSVDVIGRDVSNAPVFVCNFGAGCPIGELEILHKHKAVADCVAATDNVKVAKMTSRHFQKVIGCAKDFLERQAATDEVYSYYRHTRRSSN